MQNSQNYNIEEWRKWMCVWDLIDCMKHKNILTPNFCLGHLSIYVLCCETFHFVSNLIKLEEISFNNQCMFNYERTEQRKPFNFHLWAFHLQFLLLLYPHFTFIFHCSKINWKTFFFYFLLSSAHVVVVVVVFHVQFDKE